MIVGTSSGLCNRLRMISCWKTRCEGLLKVFWPVNTACPAFFYDLFHPINGVNCIKSSVKDANRHRRRLLAARAFTLLDLDPISPPEPIDDKYVAVHVRRTDIYNVVKKNQCPWFTDEDFFKFIDDSGLDRVYLATDNQKTQGSFSRRYGSRLIVSGQVKGFGSQYKPVRCTSVTHAIHDLYSCVGASAFMGTLGSSFSGEIKIARARQANTKKENL